MLKFHKLDITSTGDSIVVDAVPNKRIRVIQYTAISDSDCLVTFKSGNSKDLTGPMSFLAAGGVAASITAGGIPGTGIYGLFETDQGEPLVLNNDAGNIGGHLTVYLV